MSHLVPKERKIYGNYKVFSPNGELMFRCDEKKANWYLKRDLAFLSEDKNVVLKFRPNGLGNHNKDYGLNEMQNVCVVCGTQNYLTRHHVVPISYRKYFPIEIKSHNFHDVLSLCVDCHESYERKADDYKNELSLLYKAPIVGLLQENKNLIRAKKIASSILNFKHLMPKDRYEQLKKELREILNVKRLHKKRIIDTANLNFKIIEKTHGQIVVENVDIKEFIISWRKHFTENNDCKFLPKNWSIYYE